MSSPETELALTIGGFAEDPLGFVMFAFPWDDPASGIQQVKLQEPWASKYNSVYGPDKWACEFLDKLGDEIKKRQYDGTSSVDPIQFATASGHGIGKSTLTAWLILFIMSCYPFCKGVVTATTQPQLATKTWSELGKWLRLCITQHWFVYSSGRASLSMYQRDNKETWRVDAQTSKEENSESFAGLHAANSVPFYIFDEACHDDKTEVLTNTGWKLFKDLTQKDLLLTPNGFEKPSHVHISHREGDMLEVKKRGLSLSVTPNHIIYGKSQKGIIRKKPAKHVSHSGLISPRTVEYSQPPCPVSNEKLRLDAWYCSEGHLLAKGYGFGITNNKDKGISDLLNHFGFKWGKNGNQWLIYDKDLASEYLSLGKGCLNKTVPPYLFKCSQEQIRTFLLTFLEGDGYWKNGVGVLYTSSKRMAKDLHALAVLAGYNSSHTVRPLKGKKNWIVDHWATSSVDGHVITLSTTRAGVKLTKSSFSKVSYSGMVYCATVPSGLLLTRRDGTVIWSGNSGIPDKIFEVRQGGTTDGMPMVFDFGNPTRNSGQFFEECVGSLRHRYHVLSVDSRDVAITNKVRIQQWIEDYGEDSDFVKVRVRGVFPSAGSAQFINSDDVHAAQSREHVEDRLAPLVLGVDVARFGDNESVIYPRLGNDARSFPPRRYRGLDNVQVAGRVAEAVREFQQLYGVRTAAICVDATGVGGGVVDQLTHLGYYVISVNNGSRPHDPLAYRMRGDEIWGKMRDALKTNLELPPASDRTGKELFSQLTQREYGHSLKGQIVLETKSDMKERGLESPDIADALALTFAADLPPIQMTEDAGLPRFAQSEYDPMLG